MTLIDELHEPPLRQLIGQLLATSTSADIAITHLRLVGLDLGGGELGSLEKCRVMIGRLNASHLVEAEQSRLLAAFAKSGRLEMRTAPHHVWTPDFSVFRGRDRDTVLLGAHYFGKPYPLFGLALTAVLTEPAHVGLCARRFEELWSAGYDVLPVVIETLDRVSG